MRLSGQLAVVGAGVAFSGPADVEAGDPKALAAWVEGPAGAGTQGELRPLRLRGDMTMSSDKTRNRSGSTAEFEHKPLTAGSLYAFAAGSTGRASTPSSTRLNSTSTPRSAFGKRLLAGSNLQRPQDMAIKADIGRADYRRHQRAQRQRAG